MNLRATALLTLLLFLSTAARLHAAAPRDHAETEPVIAAMSIDYVPHLPVLLQPSRQTLRSVMTGLYTAAAARFTTLSNPPSLMESIDALPVIGTVRRRAGRRFNTDDASIEDFAICYRLSSRIGLQMIPGDPAPVKLAVSTMKNNAGATFGMTFRLSRR